MAGRLRWTSGRYAVLKYSFGLATFGLYALIVIAFPSRPYRSALIDAARAVLITAALFAFELSIFRSVASHISTLEEIDRNISDLTRSRPDLEMLYSTAVVIDGLPAGFNFTLSKVSLQSGWATGYDTLYLSGALPSASPKPATLVVIARPATRDCSVATRGDFVVVHRACIKGPPNASSATAANSRRD